MYVKKLISLLATGNWKSIYQAVRQVEASDPSAIWYALKRLETHGVINENKQLTDLGWRLSNLIKATEQGSISRDECVRSYGPDAIKVGEKLRIIVERESVISVKEIVDPLPQDVVLAEMESSESRLALGAASLAKRVAGFLRPWQIIPSLELSLEEKLALLEKWYEEYWPEVHAMLGAGIMLAPVAGPIIVNEANKILVPGPQK
jgi:hypothetical protein